MIAVFLLISPLTTGAQSVEELQRQIAYLLQQIKILQSQQNTGSNQWCYTFNQNLGVGAKGDEVGFLQTALEKQGFTIAEKGTDYYYGENTASAVSQFQQRYASEILTPNGLSAPTGYFGPSSRAKMNSLYGCNTQQPMPYPTPVPGPLSSLIVVSPNGGEKFDGNKEIPVSWSMDHSSDSISVYLSSFYDNVYTSKLLSGGPGGQVNRTWFNIPANIVKVSGQYRVGVCDNSRSPTGLEGKPLCDWSDDYFFVSGSSGSTINPSNRPPVIHGTEGPTTLKVGETGTWTINASDPENGPLSYSVSWGDETSSAASTPTMDNRMYTQTTTFTHTYSSVGVFRPVFYVKDNADNQQWTSISVNVGGGTSAQPSTIISSNPPNGAIDARRAVFMPSSPLGSGVANGWRSIKLKFSGNVSGITPSDFAITTSGDGIPVITGTPFSATTADTLSVDLDRPIPVNQRTRITYKPTNSSICLGYLPGDVDQSGMVAPADILQMIDIVNGKDVPLYVGDIDGSGLVTPADQLTFTDLFNQNNGKTLPACPSL